MSAAPPTESAVATRIDLEMVDVAAAVLDYSHAAKRLSRLSDPLEALEDPWVVHELAAAVTFVDMNRRAADILGVAPDSQIPGRVSAVLDENSDTLGTFKAHFIEILDESLTSPTHELLSGQRAILVDWTATDTSYRHVVIELRDVTAGGGDITKAPLDLNAAIEATIDVARNEWESHCEVALDLDNGLPPVPAIAEPLKRAILAVVVNAAQAVQDAVDDSGQKGTIAISTAQRGDSAVLKITDSGVGIPPAIQSHIFDPAFTTRKAGRGSGEGLTICRTAIVEQHGGTLEFETEPGFGTTFIITLPLHIEEDIA